MLLARKKFLIFCRSLIVCKIVKAPQATTFLNRFPFYILLEIFTFGIQLRTPPASAANPGPGWDMSHPMRTYEQVSFFA